MSKSEKIPKRSAMVAWVESKLKHGGYVNQVSAVKHVLEETLPLRHEDLRGFADKSKLNELLNMGTEENKIGSAGVVMSLAILVEGYMKEFLLLDLVESTGFYNAARLPRSLLEENGLEDYIEAAEASAESARYHLDFLRVQQQMDSQSKPNSYVCIISSSGTGKTQLAATASLTYEEATTIYLNMGVESTQRFYTPHIDSMGSRTLMAEIGEFIDKYRGEVRGGRIPRVTANGVKHWAARVDDGTSCYVRLLYHILTGEAFRREDVNVEVKLSELKRAISGKKFFVFLDEVPAKTHQNFEAVLCLRDTLRYLGIAPILMSTHTGSQDYVGATSRQSLETWTWIMSALPKYALLTEKEDDFLKDTERPLILGLVQKDRESGGGLRAIVKVIQEEMQKRKTEAWTESPALQLVQLFETDVEINGEWFASAHSLVGHHFGWLTQGGEDGRKSYSCTEAVLFGKNLAVAPVCATTEPLLYLALVTWNEEMLLEDGEIMFPLVDSHKNPLTVRGAFNLCTDSFKCKLSIENQKAEKNDGNLLEVLVHASLTLASMKTGLEDDSMFLGNMVLKDFIPLVRMLMLVDHLTELPQPPSLFDEIDFEWPMVPALGSSNSGLPIELCKLPNSSVGFLDRPEDKEMVDGQVYNLCRVDNTEQPFISVECKNYRDGVSSKVLKEAFKRIKYGIKCGFVFVSYVQSNAFERTALRSLKEECFKAHTKDSVSVVVWDSNKKKDPAYLQVGGEHGTEKESFEAKEKVSLLVVVIAVGSIEADVSRKRKLTYPPCANR